MGKKLKKYTNKKVFEEKDTLGKIREVLVSYIKGQLIVMLVTMFIFYLILSYLDVRFALVLSVITGAFSIVPVFGMMTASVITLIFVIVDGKRILELPLFLEATFILILYFLFNQIIDWIVSPLIIGKSLKIHPLILFFAVIVALYLFGIVGALLAAPTLAVIKIIWISLKDHRIMGEV